jgi:uncharacterized protein YecT (DUF1311 family)
MKYLIITILFLFANFASFSQSTFSKDTSFIERQYFREASKAASTGEENEAAQKYYDSYDNLLNKTYRLLLSKLSSTDKTSFINAQKQWIIFRDLEFNNIDLLFSSDNYFGGGSMTGSMILCAKAKWVKNRCVQLSDLIRYSSVN